MGKTHRRVIDDDFIEFDDDFMDMESDDNFDFLFEPGTAARGARKTDGKPTIRRVSGSRSLPDDWQDFDYGVIDQESFTPSNWR